MPQTIDIPYVGEVEFPDSMSADDVTKASARLYDTRKPAPPFEGATPGSPLQPLTAPYSEYQQRVLSGPIEGIPITPHSRIQQDIERLNAEELRGLDAIYPSVSIPTEVPGTELPKTPIELPRFTADERASGLAKAGVGLYNVAAGLAEFPLNPEGAAVTAATAGAGAAGGLAARGAGLLWGAYGIKETPRLFREAVTALREGNAQQKTESLAALGLNTLIGAGGIAGALAPKTTEALAETPTKSVETEAALGGQPIREMVATPAERTLMMEPSLIGQVRPGEVLPEPPKATETPPVVPEPTPTPETAPTAPQQAPAGLPEAQAKVSEVAKTEGKRSAKDIKDDLVSEIQGRLQKAPSEGVPGDTVTIEIPDDGTFVIPNTVEALSEVLKRAKAIKVTEKAPGVPRGARKLPESEHLTKFSYEEPPAAPIPEQPVKAAEADLPRSLEIEAMGFSPAEAAVLNHAIDSASTKLGEFTTPVEALQKEALRLATPANVSVEKIGTIKDIKAVADKYLKPATPVPEPAISFPGIGSLRERQATAMELGKIRKSEPELWKAITQHFGVDAPAKIAKLAKARFQLMKDLGGKPPESTGPTPALGEVGMGGAKPAEFRGGFETPTATKNATVDRERIERGLEPLMSEAKRDWGTVWDQAMGKIDADPRIQDELIASLKKNPRPLASDVEKALMLHRRIELRNEYAKQTRELAQAYDDAQLFPNRLEAVERHKALLQEASDKLQELEEVLRKTGTETARALAIRKAFANDEFELVQMELDARAARGGRPLTDQERTDLIKAHQRIAELQKAYDDLVQDNEKKARTEEAINRKARVDIEKKKWRRELEDERRKQRTVGQKTVSTAQEVLDLSREIMTSTDLSAVLRQGNFIVLGHPIRASKSIVPMLKAFASEEGAARVQAEIESRPNAKRYASSGLALTDYEGTLSKTEEAIRSRWAGKIPILAGSQRAYVTFLNKLRADSFDTMVKNLKSGGTALSPKELSAIADFINTATGRADLGKFNKSADLLSTVFFSPRFQASRFQLLMGKPLYGGTARTRVAIAKEYGRYLVALGTVYALGQFAGAEIELDPRSTDFGKLKFGNSRSDLMGGLSQNTVLLSRLATRQVKTLSGDVKELKEPVKFGQPNVASVAGNFLRTKLAPIPGGLLDFWNGRNVAGEVMAPQDVLERQVQPMALRDIYDVMVADGVPKAAALGLLAILGAGLQQYDDPKVRAAVSKYMHNVHGGTPAQREAMRQELMRSAARKGQ